MNNDTKTKLESPMVKLRNKTSKGRMIISASPYSSVVTIDMDCKKKKYNASNIEEIKVKSVNSIFETMINIVDAATEKLDKFLFGK